jgi:tRNA modification GTPase
MDASVLGDGRTIAAIATAHGRGALAMVRLSGPAVPTIMRQLLHPPPTRARAAVRARFVDGANGQAIDDVVATFYEAPHSFTGEHVLEISTHGGSLIPTMVLAAAVRAGAREAHPGEFTRRAVLNGKLDLIQAEAIGDLIDARSSATHRQALRQLDGGLSNRIRALRERLLQIEALLAYDIDFPEEDDGPIPRERIIHAVDAAQRELHALLATADAGTLVHDGALIVFAGAPNAGKSSLFNALLGEARAIVTEVAGTTRDAIEAVLDRPRWPLRLVDTAGLRSTTDALELLGIETSARYLANAALVLACGESRDVIENTVKIVRERTGVPVLAVRTKADLASSEPNISYAVSVSAQTGEGLATLLDAIDERLGAEHQSTEHDSPGLTRARHRAAVSAAAEEIDAFSVVLRERVVPASIAAVHIRSATAALDELIGAVHTDDILDVVFRQFCVGK